MNEFKDVMRHAFATPEIMEASKRRLRAILDDLHRIDPSFSSEIPQKIFEDLHAYFFERQFTALKEDIPQKVKNWVLFHQHKYEKKKHEKDERE